MGEIWKSEIWGHRNLKSGDTILIWGKSAEIWGHHGEIWGKSGDTILIF